MLLSLVFGITLQANAQDQTLILRDVILRYEAGQELGTVALVICN